MAEASAAHNRTRSKGHKVIYSDASRCVVGAAVIPPVGIFADTDERLRHLLSSASDKRIAVPDEVLIQAGDHDDTVYIMLRGEVEAVVESNAGTSVKRVMQGPSMFGEAIALGLSSVRSATVRALSVCDLRTVAGPQFQTILKSFRKDRDHLLQACTARGGFEPKSPATRLSHTCSSKSLPSLDGSTADASDDGAPRRSRCRRTISTQQCELQEGQEGAVQLQMSSMSSTRGDHPENSRSTRLSSQSSRLSGISDSSIGAPWESSTSRCLSDALKDPHVRSPRLSRKSSQQSGISDSSISASVEPSRSTCPSDNLKDLHVRRVCAAKAQAGSGWSYQRANVRGAAPVVPPGCNSRGAAPVLPTAWVRPTYETDDTGYPEAFLGTASKQDYETLAAGAPVLPALRNANSMLGGVNEEQHQAALLSFAVGATSAAGSSPSHRGRRRQAQAQAIAGIYCSPKCSKAGSSGSRASSCDPGKMSSRASSCDHSLNDDRSREGSPACVEKLKPRLQAPKGHNTSASPGRNQMRKYRQGRERGLARDKQGARSLSASPSPQRELLTDTQASFSSPASPMKSPSPSESEDEGDVLDFVPKLPARRQKGSKDRKTAHTHPRRLRGRSAQRRKLEGWQQSLCQHVAICYPSSLPSKDTFAQRKVPRPVSPETLIKMVGTLATDPAVMPGGPAESQLSGQTPDLLAMQLHVERRLSAGANEIS